MNERNGYLRIVGFTTDFKVSSQETAYSTEVAFITRWYADGSDAVGSCNTTPTDRTAAIKALWTAQSVADSGVTPTLSSQTLTNLVYNVEGSLSGSTY